jgi:hypothetical protein
MIAMFATAAAAQKMPTPTLWEDTATNPHDFTDEYYASNGILSKEIIGRRTGDDLLSVLSPSSNPNHTWVRVIATLPAYGPSEEILFWYPLGRLNDRGFTGDKLGVIARETALGTPLYVFPMRSDAEFASFTDMRQSALFGPSETYYSDREPIKLLARRIVEVRYTEKAFDKESFEMMQYMLGKNGAGVDGLPIIRSMADLSTLAKHEMVSFGTKSLWEDPTLRSEFAITPAIADPTGGAIAQDAFLLMPTVDGKPLPAEQFFATQFGCLKKAGYWCNK